MMPSVISCSRRTDIPAFYAPWLLNRLREGFCHTINPFGGQVYRIPLQPENVTALTFWTRNPGPMAKYLDELEERGYAFYFSVTITGSPTAFEPHSPALPQILSTFQQFAIRLGPERMRWRYDPIVISSLTPDDYHLRRFEEIAAALQGATNHCTFSFVQYYGKTSRNLESSACQAEIRLERPALDAQQSLAARLAQIAARYGMRLHTCCNDLLLTAGISKSHCVDADLIRDITTGQAGALKGKPTRKDCGCAASVDIGMYDTCLFGCAYCYATNHHSAARLHHAEHDPRDSLLWRPARLRGVDLDSIVTPRKEG